MIKSKLIYAVKDAVGKQYGDRTIAETASNVIIQIFGQLFARDLSQWDLYVKEYVADIVRTDTEVYALHPVPVIQLPDSANGVRFIYSEKESNRRFEPMPQQSFITYSKLGMSELTQTVGYMVYTDRTKFWNLPLSVEKVREHIVTPFAEWSDEEDFPLPSGMAQTIIDATVDSMRGNPTATNIYKPKQ